MRHERKSPERPPRREILSSDLDRIDSASALWASPPDTTRDALYDALRLAIQNELTPKQRQVIEAYYFEGLSQGEIARTLGISQQVVQKRIFGTSRGERLIGGALKRLKDALSPHLSPSGEEEDAPEHDYDAFRNFEHFA